MKLPFYDLSPVTEALQATLSEAFSRVLHSKHYILGQEVAQFEHEFATYCGAKTCVGTSNGLDALHLILQAAGIGAGDEVIVPAHTFIATWLAVSSVGATPVGADVLPDTGNLSPEAVLAAITPRTPAIIAVHLYGRPAEMRALQKIARQHHLLLIEDAAQAHGAAMDQQRTGTLGDVAAFSFYPTKNLGALGDAGAVVGNDVALLARVRILANYGSCVKYEHQLRGVNARLDELQAAFLRAKLPYLDDWNRERQTMAAHYDLALLPIDGITRPPLEENTAVSPVWHLYVIQTKRRDELKKTLAQAGIETLVHYPKLPHLQKAYHDLAQKEVFPVAQRLSQTVLSLPLFSGMNVQMIHQVANAIRAAL